MQQSPCTRPDWLLLSFVLRSQGLAGAQTNSLDTASPCMCVIAESVVEGCPGQRTVQPTQRVNIG